MKLLPTSLQEIMTSFDGDLSFWKYDEGEAAQASEREQVAEFRKILDT